MSGGFDVRGRRAYNLFGAVLPLSSKWRGSPNGLGETSSDSYRALGAIVTNFSIEFYVCGSIEIRDGAMGLI